MEKTDCAFQPTKTTDIRAADPGVPCVHWILPSWGRAFLASTVTIVPILADRWQLPLSYGQANSRCRCSAVRHCLLSLSSFWGRRESKFSARSVNGHVIARECILHIMLLRLAI